MRTFLEGIAQAKRSIQVNFNAAAEGKLVSISGNIAELGEDYILLQDIYKNVLLVPFGSIAFIEIKR